MDRIYVVKQYDITETNYFGDYIYIDLFFHKTKEGADSRAEHLNNQDNGPIRYVVDERMLSE